MRNLIRKRALPLVALLLVAGLTGCDAAFGYDEDVSGYYALNGTVYDAYGYSVNGDIYIDHRSSSRAYADVEWYMFEGSRIIMEVQDYDVPVSVSRDGRVRFTVSGDLQLSDGGWTWFELEHDGRVSGSTMRGNWTLRTDFSTDRGTFTARR